MKVYLVYGSTGSFSDYREYNLKAFLTLDRAEDYLKAAEDYLISNNLLVKGEEETKWGRRVKWELNDDFYYSNPGDEVYERTTALMANNPFDPKSDYAEFFSFNGYKVDEIEVEE